MGPSMGAYTFRWVLAWAVMLMLLGLFNRTRLGHAAIYYLIVLAIFLLLVTQYQWLANVLAPIAGQPAVQPEPAATTGG